MKSIKNFILETLNGVIEKSVFTNSDTLTREYNNLFGMMSNTLMCVLPCGCCHAISGSKLREGIDWIFSKDIAVNRECVSEWIEKHGLNIYDNSGDLIVGEGVEDTSIIDHAVNEAYSYFSDNDFIVIL